MENIINKAIEGGYPNAIYQKSEPNWVNDTNFKLCILDPLFWQALGKACPIKEVTMTVPARYVRRVTKNGIETINWPTHTRKRKFPFSWKKHALKFHEINLTQGFEKAVEYLEDLIKDNT